MAPPDVGNQRQLLRQRQMSTDEVMVETPDIVTFFIANRVEAQGHTVPEEMRAVTVNDEVASCLRQVGDDLENNYSLNNLISQIKVTPQTAFDTFAEVATQIFSDGVYNWGRIVTLLYFGFKLASSVISQVPLIKLVVDWVVRFVKERLVNWIAQQGGWRAIKEYVTQAVSREATNTQLVGVALVGFGIFLYLNGRN